MPPGRRSTARRSCGTSASTRSTRIRTARTTRWSACSSHARRLFGERTPRRSWPPATPARVAAAGAGRLAGRAGLAGSIPALLLPAALLARQVARARHRRPGPLPAPVPRQPRGRAGGRGRAARRLAVTDRRGVRPRATPLPGRAPLVPEIALHLASEITPIWQATEDWLAANNVAPPFWAFAWPGGQALARHVLDHPASVAGRRVLDFAAGGGIAAIACALAGAASVEAAEIDRLAIAAIRLNAAANGVAVDAVAGRRGRRRLPLGPDPVRRRLLRGADDRATSCPGCAPWPRRPRSGSPIPAAPTCRATGWRRSPATTVPTTLELEDRTERTVTLYRLLRLDLSSFRPPPKPLAGFAVVRRARSQAGQRQEGATSSAATGRLLHLSRHHVQLAGCPDLRRRCGSESLRPQRSVS